MNTNKVAQIGKAMRAIGLLLTLVNIIACCLIAVLAIV